MALYAFDGTWNEDESETSRDTNVVKFKEIYAGADFEYLEGVGTRFGALGRVFGGLFGAGGRSRIDEMYEALTENWQGGDRDIDIIGFSRGAALAVHFANKIAKDGILEDGNKVVPRIRFLGVFDNVASFGLSFDTFINFNEINLGWDIDQVAGCVDHCFHAMALDERRETFNVTRLNPEHRFENVKEVWFRGVHSDVGGGNENPLRSNIALNWMLEQARSVNVPLNEARASEQKYSEVDWLSPISENKDVARDPRRQVEAADVIHPSANGVRLAVGESHTCTVFAVTKFNWSGVELESGGRYKISVAGDQKWMDDEIECGPEGWATNELGSVFKEGIVKLVEGRRRFRNGNWFLLMGTLGDEDDKQFAIGQGIEFTADETAHLYLFANDLLSKYGNNTGSLEVAIERTA